MSRGFGSVLRIRNFLLLALCGTMSQFGDRLTHMLLISVIATEHPGKLLAYSAGSFAFALPTLLVSPMAGVLVDRWDRRRVLGFAHLFQALLLLCTAGLIAATGSFVPFWIALFIFFGLDVFNNTATPALLPHLVAPRKLLLANSVSITFSRVATVLGMVVGGFLIPLVGWKYGLVINSSTHLTAGLLAFTISLPLLARGTSLHEGTPRAGAERGIPEVALGAFRVLFRDLTEVLRLVATNRLVAFVIASVVVTMFVSSVAYTVLIYLVQQVLGLGTAGVGIFAGVMAVGMIGGAALLGLLRRRIDGAKVIVAVVLLYGLMFLVGPWLVSIPFMAVVALVAGAGFSWLGIVQNTMLQEEVSAEIRGRVFSTREFVNNATFILTTLLIGALGDLTSFKTVLVVIGCVLLLAGAGGVLLVRGLGRSRAY